MKVIRFEVAIEDNADLKRVIEISSDQTFEDLHNAILKSVNFDNSQLASFYVCNDDWEKKLEITLIDMGSEDSELTPVMSETRIGDYITEKGQKLVYEYDFVLMWRFFAEVEDIFKAEKTVLPRVVLAEGEAPAQYEAPDKYPGEITDEDSEYIKELQKKNQEFFGRDDDYEDDDDFGFKDGYDEDDFDEFSGGSYKEDDDY